MSNKQNSNVAEIVFSFPFRIFFLLVSLYAVCIIPLWLGIFFQAWLDLSPVALLIWHAHEIIYGIVAAAIAGFMLTAICTWTGCKPLTGLALAGFALAWLAGRLAMIFPGYFNYPVTAGVDLSFIMLVAIYVAVVIVRSKNWRNLPMVALLVLLFSANLIIHFGVHSQDYALADKGKVLSLEIVLLMIIFIGGRIIPAFTANWLQKQGIPRTVVRQNKVLDMASLLMVVLILPADLLLSSNGLKSIPVLLAFVLLLVKLAGWQGWRCRKEPLLWVLHLGYLWVLLALLFKGLAPFVAAISTSVWVHTLGIGGIGTMILGVMTRVALGHTGRTLILPRGAVFCYWLVTLAAICRLVYGLGIHTDPLALMASGLAWTAAFAIFLLVYWPILSRKGVGNYK